MLHLFDYHELIVINNYSNWEKVIDILEEEKYTLVNGESPKEKMPTPFSYPSYIGRHYTTYRKAIHKTYNIEGYEHIQDDVFFERYKEFKDLQKPISCLEGGGTKTFRN